MSLSRLWLVYRFPRFYPPFSLLKEVAWFFFLGILLGNVGCVTPPAVPDSPIRKTTGHQLLEKLDQKEQAITSLKALFRANLQGEGFPISYRVDGVFLYKRPHTIRLKGFTRFGGILFNFLLNGDRYRLVLPNEKQVFVGDVGDLHPSNAVNLPVQLSLRAMEIVLGKVRGAPEDSVTFVEDGNRYRFDVHEVSHGQNLQGLPLLTKRVWVDGQHLQVNQVEYLSIQGEKTLAIHAKDFRRVKDASPIEHTTIILPYQVQAENFREQGSVALEFQEIVANVQLDPKEFGLASF